MRLATLVLSGLLLAGDGFGFVPGSVSQEAWVEALDLGGGLTRWGKHPPEVRWFRELRVLPDGRRQYGESIIRSPTVTRGGELVVYERVELYLLADERDMIRGVLLHEYLHCVWVRRWITQRHFRRTHLDTLEAREAWVCGMVGC